MPLGHSILGTGILGAGSTQQQAAEPDLTPRITGMTVTPSGFVLLPGTSQQFDVEVRGVNNPPQGVTWTTTHGQIDAAGLLLAPAATTQDQNGFATATSTFDPSFSASASFTVPALLVEQPPVLQPGKRYARPARDIKKGNWTASSGVDLFRMLEDLEEADYIAATSADDCELGLAPVEDPGTSSGQVVRYKAHATAGGFLAVELRQGATLIARWEHASLPDAPTLFEQFLTADQCDSITDYGDLRIKLLAA